MAALEATPVSVCVIAENWYVYFGGVMSLSASGGLRVPVFKFSVCWQLATTHRQFCVGCEVQLIDLG